MKNLTLNHILYPSPRHGYSPSYHVSCAKRIPTSTLIRIFGSHQSIYFSITKESSKRSFYMVRISELDYYRFSSYRYIYPPYCSSPLCLPATPNDSEFSHRRKTFLTLHRKIYDF